MLLGVTLRECWLALTLGLLLLGLWFPILIIPFVPFIGSFFTMYGLLLWLIFLLDLPLLLACLAIWFLTH